MHVCIHVQGCCVRKRFSFHVMFYFIKAPIRTCIHTYIHTMELHIHAGLAIVDCVMVATVGTRFSFQVTLLYVCRGWIRLGSPPAAQGGVQLQNAHGARVLGLVFTDVEEYIVQTFHHWPATQTGQLQIRWWWWRW